LQQAFPPGNTYTKNVLARKQSAEGLVLSKTLAELEAME
jgi:hypothetical protein